jgi:hypothetical protein
VSYNSDVPTPFYHLSLAEDLLVLPDLRYGIRRFLQENRPAFLLGNTAPDVQTISGQLRSETHFFELPLSKNILPAWDKMLADFHGLAASKRMQPSQAAFLAGYLCHLQADWFWIEQIYEPVFGPECRWENFKRRLYLHNVLRSYLDQRILNALPARTDYVLAQAMPVAWLPFTADYYLVQWRNFLAHQLHPGSSAKTVEVFAARQGISPDRYYQLLASERLMDDLIFRRISFSELEDYRQQLLQTNLSLLERYLAF